MHRVFQHVKPHAGMQMSHMFLRAISQRRTAPSSKLQEKARPIGGGLDALGTARGAGRACSGCCVCSGCGVHKVGEAAQCILS